MCRAKMRFIASLVRKTSLDDFHARPGPIKFKVDEDLVKAMAFLCENIDTL